MELMQRLSLLCAAAGPSGAEGAAADAAAEQLAEFCTVRRTPLGSVIGERIPEKWDRHVLLEAHIDEIGLVVTALDGAFLRVDRVGGVDRRTLPAGEVTVWGKRPIGGVFSSVPPHLSGSDDRKKFPEFSETLLDTGLSAEELSALVSPGDRVTLKKLPPARLLDGRISAGALDDRCCVAAILRALELLSPDCRTRVTVLFAVREETGQAGAKTGAFGLSPDEAIALDVSFAFSPGCDRHECGVLGDGPMIGISPVLSRRVTDGLFAAAKRADIPFQTEVMGGDTGTDADELSLTQSGIPTGLVSVPLRYMHTAVETADEKDLEDTARLLAAYLSGDDRSSEGGDAE